MSEVQVDKIQQQCGTTLTVGGGASKTVTVDATTVTLGRCSGTVTLASGATQSGFGRSGTVDWQTSSIKTATFTAANGEGYFCNTSGGAFTVNLPAGSAGNIVSVVDYTNSFQTHALTVTPNGSEKIGGTAASVALSTEGQSVTFVYVDGTEGWKNVQDSTSNVVGNPFIIATGGTITTSGNCKIHTFTGPGTFTVVSTAACSSNNKAGYLVVAGGGSGAAAGGGAGGFREGRCNPVTPYTDSPLSTSGHTVTEQAYPITVGAGGANPNNTATRGSNGSNSIFSTITSTGGGAGGAFSDPSPVCNYGGAPGGSGGGSGPNAAPGSGATFTNGGTGNTPPASPPQGNTGGNAYHQPGCFTAAGGGGGATAVGANASPTSAPGFKGGNGGNGATTHISASPVSYAGGGGAGSSPTNSGGNSTGGTGGGGAGNASGTGTAGTTNRGGGGGGSAHPTNPTSASGGSGIVVIRYRYQ